MKFPPRILVISFLLYPLFINSSAGSGRLPTNEGTFSWGGMFSSTYWVDPKEKMVGLFFTNIYPMQFGDIHDRFKVLMYQSIND